MQWTHTAIPKCMFEQIRKIHAALGYASPQAFITEATRRLLYKEERRFDEIEHERNVGRKVLGKTDEGEL